MRSPTASRLVWIVPVALLGLTAPAQAGRVVSEATRQRNSAAGQARAARGERSRGADGRFVKGRTEALGRAPETQTVALLHAPAQAGPAPVATPGPLARMSAAFKAYRANRAAKKELNALVTGQPDLKAAAKQARREEKVGLKRATLGLAVAGYGGTLALGFTSASAPLAFVLGAFTFPNALSFLERAGSSLDQAHLRVNTQVVDRAGQRVSAEQRARFARAQLIAE